MSNISFHPLATRRQLDPTSIDEGMERLALFVPACRTHPRSLGAYALAYIEHVQGDLLQLEHEQELLCTALAQAWQSAEYDMVIVLVEGLAHIAGRFNDDLQAEQVLLLGIDASRQARDARRRVLFLNRLGSLLFAHGKYHEAQCAWYEGLQLAEAERCPQQFWYPFASFASIVDIFGSDPQVRQFLETHPPEMPDARIVIRFVQGFRARVRNDLENAREMFACCLRLLAEIRGITAHTQLFTMVVQAELARAQGDYARSQAYTESALALAQVFSDRHTMLALLFDQALYTYQQGRLGDAYSAFLRLRNIARLMQTPQSAAALRYFKRLLPTPPVQRRELLSEREIEVLRLVAEGYASREIAARLVITPGTVKKHLEHIYTHLDVHNRTSAIARARVLNILP